MDNQDDYKVIPRKQETIKEDEMSNTIKNQIILSSDKSTTDSKDLLNSQSFSKTDSYEKENLNENSNCDLETNCTVHLLNGGKFECLITSKTTGKDVFRQTCDYLILREHEYFGLTYRDSENVRIWVNLDKKINKIIKENPNTLHFEVKFFPEPTDLKENITRFFLCLQIRNNILEEKIICSEEAYAVLGSYLVQSEMGNYDPEKHKEGYLNEFKFAPDPSENLVKRLAELHKQRKGLTAPESELAFLQNAKNYSIYGLDFYTAKDSNDSQITIGVCSSGLSVYKKNNCIEKFPWLKIMKISYNLDKFYIKVKPSEKTENLIGFNLSSARAAKDLWKITVDHHTFFKSFSKGSTTTKHSKKVIKVEEKKSKHHHKSSSSNNLKIDKSSKSHSKHKDIEKSEKETAKLNTDKHKSSADTKIKKNSSDKLNKSRHHHEEKSHHSSSWHKRKKESENSHYSYHHHHKDHYHEESSSKDKKQKDSLPKSTKDSSLSSSKNKKHKYKHEEESERKISSESRHRTENKEKRKSPAKNKDDKTKNNSHDYKKHKHKKSKKNVENKLSFSPLIDESLMKKNMEEKSYNKNIKKVSSHYIKDIINLELEKKNEGQLKTIVDQNEKNNLESSSKKETSNSDFHNKENSFNSQVKTINSPKKDMKLYSKSDTKFDIFWNSENNDDLSKNELSKTKDNKEINKNGTQNSNNKDEKIFIPRVLLNGSSSSKNNKMYNNNQDENQNKKGPKTPPYEDIAYDNTMSNQSLPTPTQDESQHAINDKFNNSFCDSNVNSIKSLSPSSHQDSDSQQNLLCKNQSSSINHYSNSIKASKNEIYDPEAPLESPENSPCQKNNSRHSKNSQKNTYDSSNLQCFNLFNSKSKMNGENIPADMEIDSPFSSSTKSPISNKPPSSNNCLSGLQSSITAPALKTVLDHLIKVAQMQHKNQNTQKGQQNTFKKPAPVNSNNSIDQSYYKNDNLDEIPSSAVELNSREKYIKKLNRQERVVEELKCSLKPFYQKREINKEEYKEIMRKAVPKICHSKTGEINPIKIKQLVKSYISKAKHARKSEKS